MREKGLVVLRHGCVTKRCFISETAEQCVDKRRCHRVLLVSQSPILLLALWNWCWCCESCSFRGNLWLCPHTHLDQSIQKFATPPTPLLSSQHTPAPTVTISKSFLHICPFFSFQTSHVSLPSSERDGTSVL